MKSFLSILILSIFLLFSCAKPTVVNVVLPNDKDLSCKQLETSITDAQEFRRQAIGVTGNTPQNQARGMLFWPALMATYLNAHEAIVAANERSVNLINLMSDKNCDNSEKVLKRVASTPRLQTLKDLSQAYKDLKELYESGALTDVEFRKEKKQVLGQ
tara:strand:+ start:1295 stop:1768 length:474 start_codon:yes stop_codon:yes gene_type:complete